MDLTEIAVVVLAESHNPTILHPSFLTSEKIVPSEWELRSPPVCTPPFAEVSYQNGLTITVQEARLQFRDSAPARGEKLFEKVAAAKRYILKLPYVRYKRVGLNFGAFIGIPDAKDYILDRFFRKDCLAVNSKYPDLPTFSIQYVLEVGVRNISIETLANPGKPAGIGVSGNYHLDLRATETYVDAANIVDRLEDRLSDFESCIAQLVKV